MHPPTDSLQGDLIVTLYVSNDREVFRVHQNLLCNASPVFKAALAGNFRESSDHSMDLPEEDVGSVNRLVQWLYSKRYDLDQYRPEEPLHAMFWQLARFNALADKYDIVTLRNNIVERFFRLIRNHKIPFCQPSTDLVEYVYTNSSQRCSLRDLLAAIYCWKVDYTWYSEVGVKDKLNSIPAFGGDIAIAMAQRLLGKEDPFKRTVSVYFEIGSQEDPNKDHDDSST